MPKTFAIGDIHGDYDRAVELLERGGLVDSEANWSGGDATLIFIGDLTDRGRQGVDTMRLVMRLQQQAQQTGGSVESLMGNHDALLLATAWEQRGADADPDCLYYFRYNGGKIYEANEVAGDDSLFDWLRQRPMMAKVGDTLFQHADGTLYYTRLGAESGVEAVNEAGKALSQTARGAYSIFYDMTGEREWNNLPGRVAPYLAKFGAKRVIHGHTRHLGNGSQISLGGIAINIDNSMCHMYRQDEHRGLLLEVGSI